MLVFVDESGDTGLRDADGSTRFFVLTLVVFETEEAAEEVSRRIDALRRELHLPARYEFHFFKTKSALRRAFLMAVRHGRFGHCTLVVDKRKLSGLNVDSRETFYRRVCEAAFSEARPWLCEANVQFDQSGSREFRRSLASHLLRAVNQEADGFRRIKKIGTQESKGNNLMQLADMICGAVARAYQEEAGAKDDKGEFRRLVQAREYWVRRWPD